MIEYDFVPLHLVGHEIAPNVSRHHREISEGDGSDVPNIDWESYLAASIAGQVWVVTARDKGKLVAYDVFTISPNMRYQHIIEASGNGVFIEKQYRGIGKQFIQKAEEFLKSKGVHEVSYIVSGERVGKFLGRGGYKPTHTVWSKKLNG